MFNRRSKINACNELKRLYIGGSEVILAPMIRISKAPGSASKGQSHLDNTIPYYCFPG
jgi:hypothetical protein